MEAKTQILIAEKKEEKSHAIRDRDDEHFHVLAVDDSVIERKMLEKLLTISSYHVTCVESGDKALEYLGLINCHGTQVLADATHVDHHHDHGEDDDDDDGDDSDDHDNDEHNNNNVGRSMIFPSLPLHDNAHHHQHGQGTRVNLIMTDYSMPGMSGYDLLKRVKESSWKDVPVVVMSSENVPSRIHMCLEEGAEEFLLKPVRMSDLEKLQPHILKSTPSTSDRKSNILAAIDNNNKIFKEETTAKISDDHDEGRNTNSKEGQDKGKSLVKIDIENFSMISKFDQL